jgi:hypothetical protein
MIRNILMASLLAGTFGCNDAAYPPKQTAPVEATGASTTAPRESVGKGRSTGETATNHEAASTTTTGSE